MLEPDHKTVAVLKAAKEGPDKDPYVQTLEEAGFHPCCIPVLDFEFINLEELASCLNSPEEYCGIVLTSPRAAEAVSKTVELHNAELATKLKEKWRQKPAFVVGEATGNATKALGLVPDGTQAGNAESLVPVIVQMMSSDTDPKPLLFPCSSLRRETIPSQLSAKSIDLHSITIYETIPHPDIKKTIAQTYKEKGPAYLVFFSPSGVDFCWDIWRELGFDLRKMKCIAIGPTTQKALEDKQVIPAAVAAKPNPQYVLTAIQSIS